MGHRFPDFKRAFHSIIARQHALDPDAADDYVYQVSHINSPPSTNGLHGGS
jgi:hypothetical protein